jgi:hypothetical protein
MLGIVFGVGAVIGMLAIGAGARQESLRFIEELGVRNLLVESRPATDFQELQVRRRSSPGLTERDVRILQANIDSMDLISANRSMRPTRLLPKPPHDPPELIGVRPSYAAIHNLETVEGSFFDEQQDARSGRNSQGEPAGIRTRAGQIRESERHLATGDRRPSAADFHGFRRAGAGPEQCHLHAVEHVSVPVLGQQLHERRFGWSGFAVEAGRGQH